VGILGLIFVFPKNINAQNVSVSAEVLESITYFQNGTSLDAQTNLKTGHTIVTDQKNIYIIAKI